MVYGVRETIVAVFEGHCPACDADNVVKITDVGGTQEFVDALGPLPDDATVFIWKQREGRDVDGGVTAVCERCRQGFYVERFMETGDWA